MLPNSLTVSLNVCNFKKTAYFALFFLVFVSNQAVFAQSSSVLAGLQHAEKKNWSSAHASLSQSGSLAQKLFLWYQFRKNEEKDISYYDLVRFIRDNPDWPLIESFRGKAERLMEGRSDTQGVLAWFADYPPVTANGFELYMDALLTTGRTPQAQKQIFDWWAEKDLTRSQQKKFYEKYGRYISRQAHIKRLDRLLFAKEYDNARAIARVLGDDYIKLAEARIAVAGKSPNANALINALPRSVLNDPGLLFERLRYRRQADNNAGAMEILLRQPDMRLVSNPGDWWNERHILVRRLIERKAYREAFALAKGHGQYEGFPKTQAQWVSGWLGLRFMNKPYEAYRIFEDMYKSVETPISLARASYWAGRCAHALGQPKTGDEWYQIAAKYQTTYYGQTAGSELGMGQFIGHVVPPTLSAEVERRYRGDELIQAALWLSRAGIAHDSSRFLKAFVEKEGSAEAFIFAVDLATDLQRYDDVVVLSKLATQKGLFMTTQAFPVMREVGHATRTDPALVHAIIRQESQFNKGVSSPAGAQGLMQLMPATAKETAGKIGRAYSYSGLTSDASYNISLGGAYLQRMLERFNGSYPLAIAAYNAGPGRVNGWLEQNGDPRLGNIDLLDWVEMIPIYETRNYVQRVLEGVYVYNLRLNLGAHAKQPPHIIQKHP